MEVPENFVEDLYAMVKFLLKYGDSASKILAEVLHDLNGVVHEKKYFSPRCSGYAARMRAEGIKV